LLKDLPDATFYFERALVADDQIAILWRVHGHHKDGQRVRLIGSSVMRFDGAAITSDLTCLDFAACKAQLARPIISY
jgi:predicted ester cyclase